jgi:hypothetical protein
MDYVFGQFVPSHHLDGIILSARWRGREDARLSATIKKLLKYAKEIIVFGPTIEYEAPLPKVLMVAARSESNDLEASAASYIRNDRRDVSAVVRKITIDSGAQFVDVISALCSNLKCRVLTKENVPMSFDYGHFTLSGARSVVETLKASGALNLRTKLVEPSQSPAPALYR